MHCYLFNDISKQSVLLSRTSLLVGCRLSIREESSPPLEPLWASWHSLRQGRFLLEAESCHCECLAFQPDWLVDVLLLLTPDEEDEDNDGNLERFLARCL